MDEGSTTSKISPWTWSAIIWSGIALFDATQTVFGMRAAGMHHAWVSLYVITMLSWLPWALATPFIVRLARRFPPMQLRPLSAWGAHLAACVAVATVFSGWSAFMYARWNPYLLAQPQPF